VQEVQQIVGILPGGIETNDEVNRAVVLDDMLQALSQLGVTTGRNLREKDIAPGRQPRGSSANVGRRGSL
jgi:hypothetical protein